jgi:hypothetical protein
MLGLDGLLQRCCSRCYRGATEVVFIPSGVIWPSLETSVLPNWDGTATSILWTRLGNAAKHIFYWTAAHNLGISGSKCQLAAAALF